MTWRIHFLPYPSFPRLPLRPLLLRLLAQLPLFPPLLPHDCPNPEILPSLSPIKHLPPILHRIKNLLLRLPHFPLPSQLPLPLPFPTILPLIIIINRNKHLFHPPQIPHQILLKTPRHERPRRILPRKKSITAPRPIHMRRSRYIVNRPVEAQVDGQFRISAVVERELSGCELKGAAL